jgi:hypothetical protein
VNAVYLDDAASGTIIYGNVFYKGGSAAFVGGGHDNRVKIMSLSNASLPSISMPGNELGQEFNAKRGSLANV